MLLGGSPDDLIHHFLNLWIRLYVWLKTFKLLYLLYSFRRQSLSARATSFAPPIFHGHREKTPGVVTVEWFHGEKIQGDQNQIPLEQDGKELSRELIEGRTNENGNNKRNSKKKKLGEYTAPDDCQSLRARYVASPFTAPSQGVHPNSHNIGAGLQDGSRMT